MLAIQGRWQVCFRLLTRSVRFDTASECHMQTAHELVDVVVRSSPSPREDSSPRAKTHRQAKLSTGRTANLRTPREALPGCFCWCRRERPRRAQSLGSTLRSKHSSTFTQSTRNSQQLHAQRQAIHIYPLDRLLKPKHGRRRPAAEAADAHAERIKNRRLQARAVLATYQVRHVRREPARDRARAVLRRRAVEAVSETATTASKTI